MAVKKVGTARILREAGRGGMGVVYEAEQEDLGRRVAVKELTSEMLDKSGDMAERFKREGRAHALLRHQAIPVVHDLLEKNDALYLVTEFVDGVDLQKLMAKGGALPADCVAHVGQVVADALHHVHMHQLLHRDLKPSNIMITREGDVKLMDFGIAKDTTVTDLTQEGMLVGSPPYVAPELLSGKPASPATDIWALGVTLFELLSGDRPFKGAQTAELFHNISKGKRERLAKVAPTVAKPLITIVEKCLSLKPEKRFKDAGELSRALQTCVRWMAPDLDLGHRLVALLVNRGEIAVDAVTVMDAGELDHTRMLDNATRHWQRPRRWPYVIAVLSSAAAGTAYAGIKGIIPLPPWPF